MFSPTTLGYAFIGGLLPAIIWLFFLLKEESRCPEPPQLVALAFIVGMCAVPLSLPLEKLVETHFGGTGIFTITGWATIEETLKYGMAAAFILWRKSIGKPSDYIIYLVTVALGFAAAENMLFLINPIASGGFASGLFTGDLRFLSSNLLHVIASATVGFALAYAAGKPRGERIYFAILGLILAISLHTAFNLFIINTSGIDSLITFFFVWVVMVIYLAAFEVVKYFHYRNLPKNTC